MVELASDDVRDAGVRCKASMLRAGRRHKRGPARTAYPYGAWSVPAASLRPFDPPEALPIPCHRIDASVRPTCRRALNVREIEKARELLARHLPETRLVTARSITAPGGHPVLLKLESELPTGSFKVRGALHALTVRQREGRVEEVVASSTGNHGAAVAWAADLLGLPATIFLPEGPNPVKRARIAELGATIVEGGRDLADAYEAALARAQGTGIYFLNDATDPDLPAGPGTMALEVLDQAPGVARFVVPVGDTALVRGVATAAKARRPAVRVVGVQAERAPAYTLSWREGEAITTESCDTVADGLATRTPVGANVEAIRELVDDFVLVAEGELLDAVLHLLLEEHVVAEPAGAAALAGLRRLEDVDGPTVLIVSGGNLSEEVLREAVRR